MLHELVLEGRIVNPEWIEEAQLGIDGGIITELRKQGLRGEQQVDTRGCYIFPGFVDPHVHLREDGSHLWAYKEDFASGTAAALHGGVTTVVDMPNTPEPGITAERIREKKELARAQSRGALEILFCGGVTPRTVDALAALRPEVVAYKLYLVDTGGLYLDPASLPAALRAVAAAAQPAIVHAEDQALLTQRGAQEATSDEDRSRRSLDYAALRPPEAEVLAVERVLAAAASVPHLSLNIAHVSVYESIERIKRFANVHCEVTPHHLFFSRDDALQRPGFLKTNPPVRTEDNRQRLLASFKAGAIDFLASDHAPHTSEEKARDLLDAPAGVPHLDTYGNFVSWLLVNCGVHPTLIARACAYRPARFLGLRDRGRIEVGTRADLAILDLQQTVRISRERLYTRCGWSPFEGYEFPGTVKHTISNGTVMSDYDEVLLF